MSLRSLRDFLMHGVVLQNRVARSGGAMFHVKHFCVKIGLAQRAPAEKCRLRRERPPIATQRVGTGVPVL
jgi:hypothetical protein